VSLVREKGGRDILFIGGGIIPKKDIPKLREAGIVQIFGPGTSIAEIVKFIEENLPEGSID
jgi:methylmalonyl-CoA mutase C-terminal domain/subunit